MGGFMISGPPTLQADDAEPLDILGLVRGDAAPGDGNGARNNTRDSEKAWKHAADMRYKKLKKSKGKVGRHAMQTMQDSNAMFAKTPKELIPHDNLSQKKPPKIRGSGRYRCWLPSAILRACFGLPHCWVGVVEG